ncbi:MAG: hypothetical protein COB35_11735 [Gammaproteobacteria bacterium]|nr:MAG: hypothetical protein COB35_11735 [Gammaproteobacteria bacterium]
MKNMFKTTLVAASLVAAFGATAGTVTVTKQIHSMEGLAGVTANQTSNSIAYVVAAAYAVGDKITFTFPTGALVATTFPSQINVPAVNNATAGSAIAGMGLGLLNSDASTVTYRVTSLSQPNNAATPPVAYTDRTTIGNTITLGAVGYTPASVLAANVTVTVTSVTNTGDALDSSGTRTATVAEAKTQFGTAATSATFNNVIDVSTARKSFTPTGVDTLTFAVTNPATAGWMNLATVNATAGTTVNFFGEAGKMAGLTAADFANAGTDVFTAAAAKLAVTYNGQITTDSIVFTAPGNVVLEAQKFTSDIVYNYVSAGAQAASKTIVAGLASGEWKLNGATVNIPYMPYSPSASQIMYVTNEGAQTGDILVTAFDDQGNSYDLGTVGTANAGTVTKLGPLMNPKLEAAGFTAGKLSITVTVNAPAADITVYASYNVGGSDRGFVNTDQYKGK